MALRVTSAADYALRAMIHLACLPDDAVVMRSTIADAQKIPTSFMAKILRSLVRSGLLRSARGVNGGFSLARPPSQITMLEIVETIEGPLALAPCVPDPDNCQYSLECPAASVWGRVQHGMQEILGGTTLEDLVSMPRRNGRVESPARASASADNGSMQVL